MRRILSGAALFVGFLLSTNPAVAEQWEVTESVSPIDDSKNVKLLLRSETPFVNSIGRDDWGYLGISCVDGTTSIGFWPGGHLVASRDEPTILRIDGKKAQSHYFRSATNHEAVGLGGGEGIAFIKKISTAKTLFARVQLLGGGKADMSFKLEGLMEVLPKVKTACNW